jgi:hypothetical protein
MIGVPKSDHGSCVAYIIDKLKDNGFVVNYTHPNLTFISWKHWIPSYVRNELKKKTGIIYDGYGNRVGGSDVENKQVVDPTDINALILNKPANSNGKQHGDKKNYKDINSYKPTGNLIYNKELLDKLEDKLQ